MNNPKLTQAIRLALLSAGAAVVATPAIAQQLEEVVVTGSRIVRTDLVSVSPLAIIDNEEFVISGNLNIEQKLAELPLTLPSFGPSSNNPGDGTARVNLRGLGTARTLVLVNGRRYIPSTQSGVVDLNTVPGSLIKQVDVVTGGASAVYGSDALGGVVNFQLKDDFEGVETSILYDVTGEGDGEKFNADITMGGNFAGDKGNAVVYVGYAKREPVFQGDRDFSRFALTDNPGGTSPQNSSTGVGGALDAGGSSGTPGTRLFGGPDVTVGGNTFTLGSFDSNGQGVPWVEPDSRFNYAPDNFLQLPQERFLAAGFSHYEINPKATAYGEFVFASNKVPQELAPTPAFLSSVVVNPNSVFFSPEVQAGLATYGPDADGNVVLPFIGRRMVENGSRQAIDTRQAMRLVAGLRGDLVGTWNYDGSYQFQRMEQTNLLNNDVSDSRFRQAVLTNDAGTACQDASAGCQPLNVFGPGNISAAAVGFVNVGATNITSIDQHIYNLTFAGELGSLTSAGAVGAAIGVEHREEDSTFRPDTFLAAGDVLGFNAGLPTGGGFDLNEFFGEIDVPVMENLSVWAAARFSDYSSIGNATSYATAVNWSPVEMASFRVGYQRAVRAPNVSELFGGLSNGFPGAVDPCSVDGQAGLDIANGGSVGAALRTVCEQSGVAAANVGAFTQANSQIEGSFGGSQALSEETSDTFTVGVVVEPMEGLDITLDYFDIVIDDTISVLGGGVNNILDICYNIVQDINDQYCQAVARRSDGNVGLVTARNANIGKIETSGVDLTANYRTDLSFGLFGEDSDLSLTFRSTFLTDYTITPVVALPNDTLECHGAFGNTCGVPRNEAQWNVRATWNTGPLGLSMLFRYLGEVEDDQITVGGASATDLAVPTLDSATYIDLSASYEVNDNLRVNFGIKNVFEEEPTFLGDSQSQANTFPEAYDVLGRRFFLSASYAID